jgi:branched-chain amino acid transport system permease protein
MNTIFGVPTPLLVGQLLLGLINGVFYAMLSMGLAVIFGMLQIVNFAHGSFFMLGGFVAWALLTQFGIGFWPSLVAAPLVVGLLGLVLERTMIRRLYSRPPVYGLLLTYGFALVIEGLFQTYFGISGIPYQAPESLRGVLRIGLVAVPYYRIFTVTAGLGICLLVWLIIEKTSIGARLRAATEDAELTDALGINVPLLVSATYMAGVALAALAGVFAAPIYSVSPVIGASFLTTIFAVVVIGGMGSILGSLVTGIAVGIIEGLTKVYYPPAASTVVFVLMVIVLLMRPDGLFGRSQ